MSAWAARSADGSTARLAPLVAAALIVAAGAGGALAAGPGVPLRSVSAGPAAPPPAATEGLEAFADSSRALEGLPIRSLRIVPRDIFDPLPDGRLRNFYRAANALHVRTREATVRDLLLLGPGQPWSEARAREAARALRELDFLQPERIVPSRAGDSVDVVVETRDAWTTRPEFNLERFAGQQYGSIGLAEQNLFGTGKLLAVSYEEDPVGISRRIAWSDPAVLGTRARVEWRAGNGSAGSTDVLQLSLPFFAEDAPWTYGMVWRRGTSTARLFRAGAEVASLDRRISETEVWFGRGVRRGSDVWRVVGSFLARDRTLGATRALPGAPASFAGPEEETAWRQVGVEARWWRPQFLETHGVERLDRTEDYDLGPSIALFGGLAPDALGSTADEGSLRLRAGVGTRTSLGFGWIHGSVETRLRRDVRELLRRADARWVLPTGEGHHLVLAARGVGSTRPARDAQFVVGGLSGLRAYPVHALAGTDLVRLNAEERVLIARDIARVLSLGGTVFLDAARAWGAGAESTGWFTAAGAGLRIAPPRRLIGPILRVDVAWPVDPTRDGLREPVFSIGSSQAF